MRPRIRTIVVAGIAGGLVDFVYACCVGVIRSNSVLRPWQGVASGWLGASAHDVPVVAVALGVATHFAIAITMALAFALASTRLPRQPLVFGPIYGLVLYGVMYGVVLPLRFPEAFPRWDGLLSITDILSHVGVGTVIALVLGGGRSASARTASRTPA